MTYNERPRLRPGFLWGASTSAYQVEGAWDTDGKGPSVQDTRTNIPEGTTDFKVAADHYHRYREDVALMADLGLKAYRFSIAWTRVLPDGDGAENAAGIDFYHRLIDELLAHGIEPIVTMYHFDLPQALEDKGGWSSRATVDAFTRYAGILFREYGAKVRHWLTINEQNMMILHASALGLDVSDSVEARRDLYQRNHHMLVAQARAMALCHEVLPEAKIGPAPNIVSIYPASSAPEDVLAAEDFSAIRNWLYLDVAVHGRYNPTAWSFLVKRGIQPVFAEGDQSVLAAARPDFIAFNYYMTHTVAAPQGGDGDIGNTGDAAVSIGEAGLYRGVGNPHLKTNAFGWEVDPVGFRITLREIYDRYRLPLLITENGLGGRDTLEEGDKVRDDYRVEYLAAHIEQMELAATDGVDIMGYCPWSAIDLISTHQGAAKRYGFIYVDRDEFDLKELRRVRKDSFFWYRDVISRNGVSAL